MANLYNLCRKDGTVMEYSITASDIAERIGCDRQDMIMFGKSFLGGAESESI